MDASTTPPPFVLEEAFDHLRIAPASSRILHAVEDRAEASSVSTDHGSRSAFETELLPSSDNHARGSTRNGQSPSPDQGDIVKRTTKRSYRVTGLSGIRARVARRDDRLISQRHKPGHSANPALDSSSAASAGQAIKPDLGRELPIEAGRRLLRGAHTPGGYSRRRRQSSREYLPRKQWRMGKRHKVSNTEIAVEKLSGRKGITKKFSPPKGKAAEVKIPCTEPVETFRAAKKLGRTGALLSVHPQPSLNSSGRPVPLAPQK